MAEGEDEEKLLRSAALQNANSVLLARKRAEAALARKSEELAHSISMMRATLESTSDAILVTDNQGMVTDFNAKFVDTWRLPPEVVATRQHQAWLDTIGPQMADPAAFRATIEKILAGELKESFHLLETADGRVFERHTKILRIGERLVGRVWNLRDITDRRRAEYAIEESEKMLSDFFENATIGLHLVGPDGRILRANQAELKLLGYSAEEFVGHSIAEFHVDQAAIEEILRRLAIGESLDEFEARLRCKDGTVKEVLISSNVYWEDGKFVHTRCFTRDITEQKRAELARAHLAALVESSDDAIVSKTLKGVVQTWNKGAERMFGYTSEEMVGQPVMKLVPTNRAQEENEILERLRRGERIEHYETVRQRKDGTTLDVSLTVSPIRDARGKIIGASKIARDVTDRKLAEAASRAHEGRLRQAEQQARDAAERANQSKDDFLAALSHELRTPLTPVLAILSTVGQDHPVSVELAADLEIARRNIELEMRLIDDLLDLTRVTRGKLELHVESVALEQLIENGRRHLCGRVKSKGAHASAGHPATDATP